MFYKLYYDYANSLKKCKLSLDIVFIEASYSYRLKTIFFSKFEMSSQNECFNLKGYDCIITEHRKMSRGDDTWGLLHFKASRRIVSIVITAIKHIRDNYYIHTHFFWWYFQKSLKVFFEVWVDDFAVKDFAFWDVKDNVHRSRDSHVGVQKFRQNSNFKKCWYVTCTYTYK